MQFATTTSPAAGPTSSARYQRYAFNETFAGNLAGVYGEFLGNGLAPVTVAVVEPFLNRRGEAERTRGFEGASLVTAGAWLSRREQKRPAYSLQFEDRWIATAGQVRSLAPEVPAFGAGSCQVVRSLSLTGDALNAWLDTPAERSAAYLKWFALVSVELQTAFRHWLPYLLLRDETILNDADLRNSLLFYSATRPYLARVRGIFTWDVICPDSMASVYRSGAQNLYVTLENAQRYAVACGRLDLAQKLVPADSRQLLVQVRRDPRALKGLLALEGKLVEAILALGIKGREINSKSTPKNLFRFCSDWSRSTQTRLRRVVGGVAVPQLVDLALIEGTAAVARCSGLAPDLNQWTECRPVPMPVAA